MSTYCIKITLGHVTDNINPRNAKNEGDCNRNTGVFAGANLTVGHVAENTFKQNLNK